MSAGLITTLKLVIASLYVALVSIVLLTIGLIEHVSEPIETASSFPAYKGLFASLSLATSTHASASAALRSLYSESSRMLRVKKLVWLRVVVMMSKMADKIIAVMSATKPSSCILGIIYVNI